MPETVRETIHELMTSMLETIDALLDAGDGELPLPSSHVCAQGRDVWALITNDIEHEKIHAGQVADARHNRRIPPGPMQRLLAEWLMERARLAGSLLGLSEEQFAGETAPGGWSYRQVMEHVLGNERSSVEAVRADREARAT